MSATKIGKNRTNILKLLFFTINLHFATSNQMFTYRKASHKQYLFRLLTTRNAKKTWTDQSIPRAFLLCLKRNDPQTFKSGSCKNPFLQCVRYWYNLLQWMFFILYDNWKTLLIMKNNRYSEIFVSAMLLLSLKEVRILCVISTITVWC